MVDGWAIDNWSQFGGCRQDFTDPVLAHLGVRLAAWGGETGGAEASASPAVVGGPASAADAEVEGAVCATLASAGGSPSRPRRPTAGGSPSRPKALDDGVGQIWAQQQQQRQPGAATSSSIGGPATAVVANSRGVASQQPADDHHPCLHQADDHHPCKHGEAPSFTQPQPSLSQLQPCVFTSDAPGRQLLVLEGDAFADTTLSHLAGRGWRPDVYLYDGDHSYESHVQSITRFYALLADVVVILVDGRLHEEATGDRPQGGAGGERGGGDTCAYREGAH